MILHEYWSPQSLMISLYSIIFCCDTCTNILLVCCGQKPARVLQDTLHKLFDELSTRHGLGHNIDEINLEMGSFDTDFKKKRNEVMDGVSISLEDFSSYVLFLLLIFSCDKLHLFSKIHLETLCSQSFLIIIIMMKYWKHVKRYLQYLKFL